MRRAKTLWNSGRGGSYRGELAWTFADQAASSLGNLLLMVFVARSSSASSFGVLALAFSAYLFFIGINRAVCVDPLMILFRQEELNVPELKSGFVSLTISVGLFGGIAVLIVGLGATTLGRGGYFLAIGVLLPLLVLQDGLRMASYARKNARHAFYQDVAWLVLQSSAFIAILSSGNGRAIDLVLSWAITGSLVGVFAALIQKELPNLRHLVRFLRSAWRLIPGLLGQYGAVTASGQLLPYGIAGVLGVLAAGAFRGAQVFLSVVTTPCQALNPVVLRRAVRNVEARGIPNLGWLWLTFAAPGAIGMSVFGALAYLIPNYIGSKLVGQTWHSAHSILLPIAIGSAFQWITSVTLAGLFARQRITRAFIARSGEAVAVVSCSLVLGALFGLGAFGWGFAAGALSGAVLAIGLSIPSQEVVAQQGEWLREVAVRRTSCNEVQV